MSHISFARLLPLVALAALVALSAGGATPAHGASFTVDATHDAVDATPGDGICADAGGACTLRAAVMETNALPGADTITLPVGIYTLTIPGTGEDAAATGDLDVTESLVITGGGRDSTIVDGANLDRVIEIQGAPNLALSSLTIRNGSAEAYGLGQGGGILARGTTSLSDVVIRDSHAAFGGGLYNEGTANLGNITITGNQGDGGIYNVGTLDLTDSTVTNNSGLFGGGIANRGTVSIFTSEIAQNYAAGGGGGIYSDFGIVSVTQSTVHDNVGVTAWGGILVKDGTLYISISQITSNSAGGNGGIAIQSSDFIISLTTVANNVATDPSFGDVGGIAIAGSTGSIINTTVTGNSATGVGGGVYAASGLTASAAGIINTTISGNRAGRGGGVYNAFRGELTFTNVTISDNSATISGGGIDNSASVRLANTIVANSTGLDCSGAITSVSHNVDSDGTCGLSGPGDLSNVDPLLGPLADNGGDTQTHALLAGSPAIDAGDNASCPPNDQRGGFARPQDGDLDGVAECDIGAFELVTTPVPCQPCAIPLPNPVPTPTPILPIVLPPSGGAPGNAKIMLLALATLPVVAITGALALWRRALRRD